MREDLSEVTARHNSVLEENQRLRAKLENLEQVLKVLYCWAQIQNFYFFLTMLLEKMAFFRL